MTNYKDDYKTKNFYKSLLFSQKKLNLDGLHYIKVWIF